MFDIEKARRKGMNEESIAIMQQINNNNAKRASCTGHDFENYSFLKYRCKNCGYEADGDYVAGYSDAIKHLGRIKSPVEE